MQQVKEPEWLRYVRYAILSVNVSLISYLTYLLYTSDGAAGKQQVLEEFIMLRNVAYTGYALIFLSLALFYIFTSKKTDPNQKQINTRINANLVFSIILTTFAYAIANLIYTLISL